MSRSFFFFFFLDVYQLFPAFIEWTDPSVLEDRPVDSIQMRLWPLDGGSDDDVGFCLGLRCDDARALHDDCGLADPKVEGPGLLGRRVVPRIVRFA